MLNCNQQRSQKYAYRKTFRYLFTWLYYTIINPYDNTYELIHHCCQWYACNIHPISNNAPLCTHCTQQALFIDVLFVIYSCYCKLNSHLQINVLNRKSRFCVQRLQRYSGISGLCRRDTILSSSFSRGIPTQRYSIATNESSIVGTLEKWFQVYPSQRENCKYRLRAKGKQQGAKRNIKSRDKLVFFGNNTDWKSE